MRGHTGGLHCDSHWKGSDASVVNYVISQTLFVCLKNHEEQSHFRRPWSSVLGWRWWRLSCSGCLWPAVKTSEKQTHCVIFMVSSSSLDCLTPWHWGLSAIRTAAQICLQSCRHWPFVCQPLLVPPWSNYSLRLTNLSSFHHLSCPMI